MQTLFDRFRHAEDVHAFDEFRAVRAITAGNRTGSVAWVEVEEDDGSTHTVPVYFLADIPTVMAALVENGAILQCLRPDALRVNDEPALLGWLRLRDGTIIGSGERPACRAQEPRRLH